MIKILSFEFDHVKRLKGGMFKLDLFAKDRVPAEDDSVFELEKPLYINKVLAIAGVNASGKTTALRLFLCALDVVKGFAPSPSFVSLFDGSTTFRALLWDGKRILMLESRLVEKKGQIDSGTVGARLLFEEERLYEVVGKTTKKGLASFNGIPDSRRCRLLIDRNAIVEEQRRFLGDTTGILTALHEHVGSMFIDASDRPFSLGVAQDGVDEIVRTFDSSIKHLEADENGSYNLEFDKGSRYSASSPKVIEHVMSSGTVKGLAVVQSALSVLSIGGYLLVDEIEIHLNKQLVSVVLDLFASSDTNPLGAVIVFTTHYPELLDCIYRKDNVFFLVRDRDHQTTVVKYSDRVKRIENKKSEVFLSNYIEGTAPRYADVAALREYVKRKTRDLQWE